MSPKELLFAHRYGEAADAYSSQVLQHPEQNLYPHLGRSLMALGRFREAGLAFGKANQIEGERLRGAVPCINELATSLWLAGEKEMAMLEWHNAITGISDGSIHYGDMAGGATQALLLWYGAITTCDDVQRKYAIAYLHSLRNKFANYSKPVWPSPLIGMVFEDCSFEDVLEISTGFRDINASIVEANTSLLKRRRLCQALFYSGCFERYKEDEESCILRMQMCFKLENPIIEVEWYLARDECRSDKCT